MKSHHLVLLLLSVILVSCKEDNVGNEEQPTLGRSSVSFVIGSVKNVDTRSEAAVNAGISRTSAINVSVPGCEEEFSLVETVFSMDNMYGALPDTRATAVDDNNFNSVYANELYATPYKTQQGSGEYNDPWGVSGPKALSHKTEGSKDYYVFSYGKSIAWPDDNKLIFFFQTPSATQGLSPKFYADGHVKFGYIEPGVSSQKDLLFGSSVISAADNEKSITLYHALTAVQFTSGNAVWDNTAPDKDVNTKITKVTFKGMRSSGQCDINTGAASGDSDTRSLWTDQGTPIDYVMDLSSTPLPANASDNATLLLVPQSVGGKQIDIEFKLVRDNVESGTYHCTVALPSDAPDWKAGEIHKFSLVSNRIEVAVTADGNTDNTVTLSNTGNAQAYVRAGYVFTMNSSSVCVPAADAVACFTGLPTGVGTDWIKGDDGFYYYRHKLDPGCSTVKLYTKFTKPTGGSLVEGSTPQLSIVLQCVPANKASFESAWGNTWSGYLD